MKSIKLMAILMLISITATAQQTYGEIRGILKNELNEAVSFATVKIMQGQQMIGGVQSDMEGKYNYKPLEPGLYEVVVTELGHRAKMITGVKVVPAEATYLNIKMASNTCTEVVVVGKMIVEDYTKTGAETNMYSMVSINADDLIRNSGFESGGDLMKIVTVMAADVVEDTDGGYHFRGGRSDANGIYMDGVKLLDMGMVPSLAIQNVTMFTGGVPAMYGDVLGGVVIVTTKSYFSGIREKNMRNQAIQEKIKQKKQRKAQEAEAASGVIYN